MVANALIGFGILAMVLGSWMHWHPTSRPKFRTYVATAPSPPAGGARD